MSQQSRIRTCMATLLAATVFSAAGAQAQGGAKNGPLHSLTDRPGGMTFEQLAMEWSRWWVSTPIGVNPTLDPDGADCGIDQNRPVFFLAGTTGGDPVTRSCTVPAGKSLFVPLIVFLNDYPCPDPSFEPAPGQTVESFLKEGAAGIIEMTDLLEAELDGVPLVGLDQLRLSTSLFRFTSAKDMSALDPCSSGSPQLGISDGFWMALKPLSAGAHTLHFKAGITAWPFIVEATYNLSVTR